MSEGKHIKSSFGVCHHNVGLKTLIKQDKYVIDHNREFYLFDVIPFGAVRMTQSDKWRVNPNHIDPKKRQRESVTKYFEFKNKLVFQSNQMGYTLGQTLDAVYFIPMPNTWSEKKKARMNGMIHLAKPDTDNITKGIKDALRKNDSDIWWEKAEKRYAYRGSIIIFATISV